MRKPDPPGVVGVIVIDKPAGPTSFEVVRAVRRAFDVRRVGHTGTLDPFATGVLPICVGRTATRLVPWLQRGIKEYEATVLLGEETDTLDPTGEVVATGDGIRAQGVIEAVLPLLAGPIMQAPPAYSALKVRGKRAYDLARAGQAPELAPRPVDLHEVALCSVDGPRVELRLRTGPGFYVRAFARDLALALGTVGRLDALRRTESGGFRLEDAVPLDELDGAVNLIPPGAALRGLPQRELDEAQALLVRTGRLPDGLVVLEETLLMDAAGRLLAIASGDGLCRVFDSPGSAG